MAVFYNTERNTSRNATLNLLPAPRVKILTLQRKYMHGDICVSYKVKKLMNDWYRLSLLNKNMTKFNNYQATQVSLRDKLV